MSPSKHNNRRRKDPSREPPTIDLKATVVDEGRKPAAPAPAAARADDGNRSSAAPSADAARVMDESGTVPASTSPEASRVMDESGTAVASASPEAPQVLDESGTLVASASPGASQVLDESGTLVSTSADATHVTDEGGGAIGSISGAALGSDSVQAVDAGSTPPASAEGLSGGGSAIPVSAGDFAAPSEGSVAATDAASEVEVRSPFVTSIDAPQTVDEASTPAAPGRDGARAFDAAPATGSGSPAPSSAPATDSPQTAGVAGGLRPGASAAAAGSGTAPDAAARAGEGPPAATGSRSGDGDPSAFGPDRDAADPAVPVADEDLARSSRGSVPPVSGGGAPPAPGRRAPGFGALAGAGLLGGLAGAGLIYGLQTWRSTQAPPDPRLAQIEQRLNALPRADAVQGFERRVAALETAQNDMNQRIGAAQSLAERAARAGEAANRPVPATPAAPPAPSGQPAPAAPAAPVPTAQPAAPAGTPAPAAPAPVAGPAPDLANRLAALETQIRTPPAAVAELGNRVGTLETQLRERAEAATTASQAIERRLSETSQGLERRLAETSQGLERRITDTGQGLERQLAETVQRLEGRLAETGQTQERRLTEASQGLDRRIAETDQRTQALARQLAEWNPEAIRAGLRVVLADRLLDTLNQGVPFADVLGSLRGFSPAPERVQALEPLAASGAPTVAALRQEFGSVAERIERASRGEAEGVVDRLLRMTDKVVSVRAVGDPNSNAVPDLVARIEGALERGSLREAASAWDALPEASRRVAAGWGQRLKARVAADEAARGIAADAITGLNASAGR